MKFAVVYLHVDIDFACASTNEAVCLLFFIVSFIRSIIISFTVSFFWRKYTSKNKNKMEIKVCKDTHFLFVCTFAWKRNETNWNDRPNEINFHTHIPNTFHRIFFLGSQMCYLSTPEWQYDGFTRLECNMREHTAKFIFTWLNVCG